MNSQVLARREPIKGLSLTLTQRETPSVTPTKASLESAPDVCEQAQSNPFLTCIVNSNSGADDSATNPVLTILGESGLVHNKGIPRNENHRAHRNIFGDSDNFMYIFAGCLMNYHGENQTRQGVTCGESSEKLVQPDKGSLSQRGDNVPWK